MHRGRGVTMRVERLGKDGILGLPGARITQTPPRPMARELALVASLAVLCVSLAIGLGVVLLTGDAHLPRAAAATVQCHR